MSKQTYNVVVLPGDGIGPEVVEQATRVLNLLSDKSSKFHIELKSYDFGGCAIDSTGKPLPDDTLEACKKADAILLGKSANSADFLLRLDRLTN
jgi:3-isopropylmalate dehydrogenase